MSQNHGSDQVLDIVETLLKAQLQAVKELRREAAKKPTLKTPVAPMNKSRSKSQTRMAYDVLLSVGEPLHVNDIVERIQESFGVAVTRDSLVSAMLKKALQKKEFVKTDKNTFGLLGRDQ